MYKYLLKIQATHWQSKTKNLLNNLLSILYEDFNMENEIRGKEGKSTRLKVLVK